MTCAVCTGPLDITVTAEGFGDHFERGHAAIELAQRGWAVIPLRGKYPPAGCTQCFVNLPAEGNLPAQRVEAHIRGRCPHGPELACHGVLSASTDPDIVAGWFTGRYRNANLAARVPNGAFVLDIDPRKPPVAQYSHWWPHLQTLGVRSGRRDGGGHLYFRHPGGTLKGKIVEGLDIKTNAGYVVMPPSVHPATGQPYEWVQRPVMDPPDWLLREIVPARIDPSPSYRPVQDRGGYAGESIADWYCDTRTWTDVLTGWTVVRGDGETDGSSWRHPTATAAWSATVKNGCLFVYSDNTPFQQTTAGTPHGYTRFRAYAVLQHNGDLSAAARELAGLDSFGAVTVL